LKQGLHNFLEEKKTSYPRKELLCVDNCLFDLAFLVDITNRLKTAGQEQSLEHKIGIDLTVSSTLKKPSKNYTFLF